MAILSSEIKECDALSRAPSARRGIHVSQGWALSYLVLTQAPGFGLPLCRCAQPPWGHPETQLQLRLSDSPTLRLSGSKSEGTPKASQNACPGISVMQSSRTMSTIVQHFCVSVCASSVLNARIPPGFQELATPLTSHQASFKPFPQPHFSESQAPTANCSA